MEELARQEAKQTFTREISTKGRCCPGSRGDSGNGRRARKCLPRIIAQPMPAPRIKTYTVSKWITLVLLLVMTGTILGVTVSLSGKAYNKVDPEPFRDVRVLVDRLQDDRPVPTPVVVSLLMPIVLNILLFVPWGFLMFVLLERPERSAFQAYLLTFFLALALSLGVEAWQYFLPTRVTDVNDVIWNGAGAIVGAILGHLRKRVRIAFE